MVVVGEVVVVLFAAAHGSSLLHPGQATMVLAPFTSNAHVIQENLLQDPTLFNLIREVSKEQQLMLQILSLLLTTQMNSARKKRWKEAWKLVARDPRAPYNAKVDHEIETMRLPLHELCRTVKFIDHVEEEEFSDDDEEMYDYTKQDRETNQEIYKLARLMILQSQTVDTPIFHSGVDIDVVTFGLGNDIVAGTTLEMHQSILTLKEMSGNTPLHVLCENSADTNMMKIIFECCPAEKSTVTHSATSFELVRIKNGHDCNPVHFLAGAGGTCPFSSLKLMLQFCSPQESTGFPDARLLQDDDGDLPLHWAFARGVSPRRLTALLSDCHDSLLCANNENILPMQEYVEQHCENFDFMNGDEKQALWDKIQGLLQVATGYHNDDRWSPLHAMASGAAFIPQAFWTTGLEFERDNLCTYNDDGMLPLHVAVSTLTLNNDNSRYGSGAKQYAISMEEIMFSSLEAPRMPTSSGRLALHLAVESKQDQYVIDTLLRLHPNALSTIDPITMLPPFMLAALDKNNSLDLVYSLLREDPSIVQTMTR